MTAADVRAHVVCRLPHLHPVGEPESLAGGVLNHVWRVRCGELSVIAKHFSTRVGTFALDPARVQIEAEALALLGPGGALEALASVEIKTPRLFDVDPAARVLIEEDFGPLPALDEALHDAQPERARDLGRVLGTFIGRLHARTAGQRRYAVFDNTGIQQTRLEVQYRQVGAALARAGIADAAALGAQAVGLGTRLLGPGRCLVMGDLWPRSVLVARAGLRIIDWEMAHYGQPWQDTAHLAAHLWMLAQATPEAARAFAGAFSHQYERHALPALAGEAREAAFHAGCEIIVRALGPFQDGYLYDGRGIEDGHVQRAVAQAVAWMRHGPAQRDALFTAW